MADLRDTRGKGGGKRKKGWKRRRKKSVENKQKNVRIEGVVARLSRGRNERQTLGQRNLVPPPTPRGLQGGLGAGGEYRGR